MAAKRKKASGKAKKAAPKRRPAAKKSAVRGRRAPAKKSKRTANRRKPSSPLVGPKGRAGGGDVNFTEITFSDPTGTSAVFCSENGGPEFEVLGAKTVRNDANVTTFSATRGSSTKSMTANPGCAYTSASVRLNATGTTVMSVSGPQVPIPAGL